MLGDWQTVAVFTSEFVATVKHFYFPLLHKSNIFRSSHKLRSTNIN